MNKNSQSETDIKIRFNLLCRQFANNPRYSSLNEDQTIPEDENISYEMAVNTKRYEASFYQNPATDSLSMVRKAKFIEEKKPNGFYINPIKKKIGNELSVNEWLEIIEKMDEFSKRTGIENSLTPQIQRAINGEIPSLCMLNGACNKFINMNVDGEIFKTCVFQSQSNYLGNIDEDNIKNKIIEYIDHIQIPSLDSFYNRLSKDDRFIYMQGDGCSNFRGSNNNSVYVNGIIEYIKNIIQ